jgi:hypothetical protein
MRSPLGGLPKPIVATGLLTFDNGGGGGTDEITLENPKVKELVATAARALADADTAGLKKNREEFKREKEEAEKQLGELRELWKGLDPEKTRHLVKLVSENEEAQLIADGKIDEVVSRRTDALRRDLESKVTAATTKIDELTDQLEKKDGRIKELVIDAKIRGAATQIEGFQPTAVEDAVLLARTEFDLDERDEPVARDSEGVVKMGKDGKSPLGPAEWLEGKLEERIHWRGESAGGGANGGAGGGTRKKGEPNPDDMTPAQKLEWGLANQASNA